MTVYLVRRILQALLVVLAMSLIVFIGVYAIGDPVEILISPDADQIERERAVQALGLDLPLWQQYTVFLTKALQGDLGRSFVYNEPALNFAAYAGNPGTCFWCDYYRADHWPAAWAICRA
jgi:peptide/nickel transport system permease protein